MVGGLVFRIQTATKNLVIVTIGHFCRMTSYKKRVFQSKEEFDTFETSRKLHFVFDFIDFERIHV